MSEIKLSSNISYIGSSAFLACSALKAIDIPNLETIGDDAFRLCTSLTSVEIPNTITCIGEFSFDCCPLTSVTINKNEPLSIDEYVFSWKDNATLYVPVGCVDLYAAADVWKEFKEIKEIGSATSIDAYFSEDADTTNQTKPDNYYDLSGRKLQTMPTQQGLYILNGKKIVFK